MGCGCGKKTGSSVYFMGKNGEVRADPEEWGPILWKLLHCLANKIGDSGSSIIDTDQATYVEFVLITLPNIIPCKECQEHARNYIAINNVPNLKGHYRGNLKQIVKQWLFTFHNTVRSLKGQEITVKTLEEYTKIYENCVIQQCEYNILTQNIAYAIRQNWVKIDAWRKWYNFIERLRMLSGNFFAK